MKRRWTDYEIAFAQDCYGRMSLSELARWLDRSASSVKTFLWKHGIRSPRRPRPWTSEESAYLREHYRQQATARIGAHLQRTVRSVHLQARKLGLVRPYKPFGPEFTALLQRRHAEGWSDAEIAREYGCERHTVGNHRRKLGLPANVWSDRQRERVRRKTAEQLAAAGVSSLAEVRCKAFRDYARTAGWPEDLRPRAVQILQALWTHGPMTRRQIADAIGMPWKGSRKSLVSNDPEGSYLAHLQARGLVVRTSRIVRGKGRGRSVHIYMLPLAVALKRGMSNGKETNAAVPTGPGGRSPRLGLENASGGSTGTHRKRRHRNREIAG